MFDFIIADRRDLLGGRLIPILNGLRLAEKTGGRFLTTWFTTDDAFQSLVAALPDILSGPFLESDPFGCRVGIDDPRLLAGSREIVVRPCPEASLSGIKDFFVMPKSDCKSIVLDRRLSLYAVNEAESFSDVRKDLARVFSEMPKSPIIEDAFEELKRNLLGTRLAALHLRRLHLTSETSMQVNRFDSYHTIETYRLVGEELLKNSDTLLLASDNLIAARDLKAAFPGRAATVDDLLDLTRFTGIQRALIDIMFLSRAERVVGPLSAYGVLASIIGDGTFQNITCFAASHVILAGDRTGSIAFARAVEAGNLETLTSPAAKLDEHSCALQMRCAEATLDVQGQEALALRMALESLARRLSEFGHASFFADHDDFIHVASQAACRASRKDIQDGLLRLQQSLLDRVSDWQPSESASSDPLAAYVDLSRAIVAADCAPPNDAVCGFAVASERARTLGVNPRGLHLRAGGLLLSLGRHNEAIVAIKEAIAADPSYADSWYNLSKALNASQKGGANQLEAVDSARRATDIEPDQALYFDNLGAQLVAFGDLSAAMASYRRALMVEPENTLYAAHLAEVETRASPR